MADQKITQLTEDTSPSKTDIIPMVEDPSGTPVTKKVTIDNLGKVAFPYGKAYAYSKGYTLN